MTYSTVIKNGTVVDGSGAPSFMADVAIVDGRIAAVGKVTGRAHHTIDAEGLVVAPGFIDGHTHMDAQVFWDELGTSSCWHGITTAVMGNCGFTLAPSPPGGMDMIFRNIERAEDIPYSAVAEGIDWSWGSFAEYLDAVDRIPKAINYAGSIGHSALRVWAMGERAFEAEATEDDLAAMIAELRSAMAAGALGFTSSRSSHHCTPDGSPVASRLAAWSEVEALVKAMAATGHGVYQSEPGPVPEDPELRELEHGRLLQLALESRVPFAFGIPSIQNQGDRLLALLDRAATKGARMLGLSHCRGISSVSSFETRLPFDTLPVWAEFRRLPLDQQRQRLSDEALRAELVRSATDGDYGVAIGAEARRPDYERMRVLLSPLPPNPSVADMARDRGVEPVEALIQVALEADLGQFFVQPITSDRDDELLPVLAHPSTIMAFSDSGAHVGQIMDASIQTHFLAHWVRRCEVFTLEHAVMMLTYAPARAWGFLDRGLVREGYAADLNIFDPDKIAPELPVVARDLPGGAMRIKQGAVGFKATLVAGMTILEDGVPTGARPGRLLRMGRA